MQQKALLQQHKNILYLLVGSMEIMLLAASFVVVQVIAGHYGRELSYGLWLMVCLVNALLVIGNTRLLTPEFASSEFYLPKQHRGITYVPLALYGMAPMALFLLPSGFFVVLAEELSEQRMRAILQWSLLAFALFWLHWRSYLNFKVSPLELVLSTALALTALQPLWLSVALLALLGMWITPKMRLRSHHFWLAYGIKQHKQILGFAAVIAILQCIPWWLSDFSVLSLVLVVPASFWLGHYYWQSFRQSLLAYQQPLFTELFTKLQQQLAYVLIALLLITALIMFALSYLHGVIAATSLALGLLTSVLTKTSKYQWLATASVYVCSLLWVVAS